jgi:MFS transporter, ACS family, hexuronate transporter
MPGGGNFRTDSNFPARPDRAGRKKTAADKEKKRERSVQTKPHMKKIPHLRWWIAALLFGAAVLNYVDRQTLSALAPTIQRDLAMDERDYGNIVNLFLVAYTIAYVIAGRLTDLFGTRAGMAGFVVWWSLANALTAATTGMRSLGIFRFALGLGEAGVWPAASKAVSEWFPPRERGLAIGFYTMGATVGAMLAPYIVIPLASYPYPEKMPWITSLLGPGAGWRMAFIFTGAAGLLWLVPWLMMYREPRQSRLIGAAELKLITIDDPGRTDDAGPPWTWRTILTNRVVWLLLLARLITDPVWYFYQFWFAKYLHSERGLTQEQLTVTWSIYAAAGAGSLIGGWISGRLIRRGLVPANSRMRVMLGCALLLPLSPLVASVAGLPAALIVSIVIVFASLAWLINLSAIIVDLIPRHSLGTVFSVVAAGSTLGGIIMNTLVATMVSTSAGKPAGFLDQLVHSLFGPLLDLLQGRGYGLWFIVMALLHPFAWLMLKYGGLLRPRVLIST